MTVVKYTGIEKAKARTAPDAPDVTREFPDAVPIVGQWFWVESENTAADDDDDVEAAKAKWLGCVVHLGTNFVELKGWGSNGPSTSHDSSPGSVRIHIDQFYDQCTPAPDAQEFIDAQVLKHQRKTRELMGEVQEITKALAVGLGPQALGAGNETAALALRGDGKELTSYKKALVKAKDKTLPALFEAIEEENTKMGHWMQMGLIRMKAEAAQLAPSIQKIEERIFNVELYAGLVETVVQVREGKPAPLPEKLHLFQRRHYMDEECLFGYQTGGMDFDKLADFDAWLAKDENFNRILPKPRCMVAFRIRRNDKDYTSEATSWREFIGLNFAAGNWKVQDKRTFLYIRNGEQLWRLETEIEFGAQLFPDRDKQKLLTGQLYAKEDGHKWNKSKDGWDYKYRIITGHEYQEMRDQYARALRKYRRELREYPKKFAAVKAEFTKVWEERKAEWFAWREETVRYSGRKADHPTPLERFGSSSWHDEPAWADVRAGYLEEKQAKAEKQARERKKDGGSSAVDPVFDIPQEPHRPSGGDLERYAPWDKNNTHWDDVMASVQAEMDQHNRLVLVLQGLFDRSLCLHPHAPAQLWEAAGFEKLLQLIYDDSRSLVPGPKPDLTAYITRCNASLGPGSITIGQQRFWKQREAERYNNDSRRSRSGRDNHFDVKLYSPPGNPGPGHLAKVVSLGREFAKFEWSKHPAYSNYSWSRRERHEREKISVACSIKVPVTALFNVSAYKPGDFRQFFADPRTRMDYLRWAPMLLEAEEYHAGNRKVANSKDEDKAVEVAGEIARREDSSLDSGDDE